VQLAEVNLKSIFQEDLNKKDKELSAIKATKEVEMAQIIAKLENAELEKKISKLALIT
jgi:hypothetical protein